MAINLISDGEAGLSVRTTINEAITQLNGLTTSTQFIDSEADLLVHAPLNGSNQHVLAANTAYVFGTSFSHTNTILWQFTTTECYGNGIGQTMITYTGTGNQHIVVNGSFRSRFMQWIAPVTTDIQLLFTGTGVGTGTNVSLDRTYLVCVNGQALDSTSCDFFFASAAVIISATPLVFHGLDCGIFAGELSLIRSTALTNILDLNGAKFTDIIASSLIFEGVAGSTAVAGQGGNVNVVGSASFTGCIVSSGILGVSGISVNDTKYEFQGNRGIPNSSTICFAYIDPDATTSVIDGTFVQLAGTWNRAAASSRCTVDAGGEVLFENPEQLKDAVTCSVSAHKVSGGGSADYIFEVEKSTDGGTVWIAVEGMTKSVTLLSTNSSAISWTGITDHINGDKFRITVSGIGTGIDIVAETAQLVIGG